MGSSNQYSDIFAQFKTMWRKQNLASAVGGRGGGVGIPYKKDGGARRTFLGVKKAVLVPLLKGVQPQKAHSGRFSGPF